MSNGRSYDHYLASPRHPASVNAAITAALAVVGLAVLVQRFAAPAVLAATLFVLAVAVMLLRPELATIVAVFLLYINFPAILTKQYGMPRVVAGSFILLLGLPILHYVIIRREALKADRTFYLMLAFLIALLISSFKAVDSGRAAKYVSEYILEGLLLYWLVFNVVRRTLTLRRVLWTVLATGAFLSSISLYQTVSRSFYDDFGGLAYRNIEAPPQDQGEEISLKGRQEKYRAGGPVADPNKFALLLIVLLPLAVFLIRTGRSRRARMCASGLGVLVFVGILLTASRGGLVGLVVLAGLTIGVKWIRLSHMLICALIVGITISALPGSNVPYLLRRITSITSAGTLFGADRTAAARQADGAILGRATLMLSALHVFLDHPVIGVGPGQYPPFYSLEYAAAAGVEFRDLPEGNWRAHSLYLEIAAETGLVGLVIFLASVGIVVRGLWRARRHWLRRNAEYADLATAFWLSLAIWLWTGIFEHLSYQPYYWLLLALASAALHILKRSRVQEMQPAPAPGPSDKMPRVRLASGTSPDWP